MKADRVLITGVSGFVGRNMASCVLSHQGLVIGAGRSRTVPILNQHMIYRSCDLLNMEATEKLIADSNPTHVVHLAGVSDVATSWTIPLDTIKTNFLATSHLLEAIRRHGHDVQRVLLISSNHEYAMTKRNIKPISERTAISPQSPYGWSKHMQTMAAMMYAQLYKLPIIVARTFNLVGPGFMRGVCGQLIRQIVNIERGVSPPCLKVGDTTIQRDFLDVRDAVQAYWCLLHTLMDSPCEVFNVCSGKATTIGDLIEYVRIKAEVSFSTVIDRELIRPNEPRVICGNPQKLETVTGWKPTIRIEQSLDDALAESRTQFAQDSQRKED